MPKHDSMAATASMGEAEWYAFPLAPAQRAMLPSDLASLSDVSDPRYNGSFRVAIEGAVNAAVLERCFHEIAERHEILRTVFARTADGVQQFVQPVASIPVEILDIGDGTSDPQAARVEAICLAEARTGFRLDECPPIRVKLLRCSATYAVLTLTVHQIVCDGWSIGIVLQELTALYGTLANGLPSPLAPMVYQYVDYVVWEEQLAAAPETQRELDEWVAQLRDYRPVTIAPDYSNATPSAHSEIVSQLLPLALTEQLNAVARRHETTFFVLTMAVCATLIGRHTQQYDLALRTPTAGRQRVEFEELVGQFVNQTIVRSQLAPTMPFPQLLRRVHEDVWNALARQAASFDRMLPLLREAGGAGDESAFGINFICQQEYGRKGASGAHLGSASLKTLPSKSQGALYDLNFFLVERESGWRLSLEYKTDLYSQRTAGRLIEEFVALLADAARDPQRSLAGIEAADNLTAPAAEAPGLSLAASALSTVGEAATEPKEPPQALPASFAQERFWTLFQIDPDNAMFNVPVAVSVAGPLSIKRLTKSLHLLVERHESLRTSFSEIDGTLLQIVHPDGPVNLSETHLASESATLEEILHNDIRRPFDLATLPLFRCLVCHRSEQEHILLLTIHHILSDAWSIGMVQQDLWAAYEALAHDADFSLPPLPIQYADYAVWQRERAAEAPAAAHLAFWSERLGGELPVLDFPTDSTIDTLPSGRSTHAAGLETMLLPSSLSGSLKRTAQTFDTTLFVVTLACYAMVLGRACNADDLIVGTPIVNRRLESEAVIGPFAGPVALRFGLAGDPTVAEVIAMARQGTLEALEHADLPFELLLEKLRFRSQSGRNPLFQFYFFCQQAFLKPHTLADITVDPLPSINVATPFEMQLAVVERAEGLRLELEYDRTLFHRASVELWLHYYQSLLEIAVSQPMLRLSQLPIPPRASPRRAVSVNGASPTQRAVSNGDAMPMAYSAADEMVGHVAILPRDAIEVALSQIWLRLLNVPQVGVTDTFFSLGGHSLLLVKLLKTVNKVFDLNLEITVLFQAPTIEKLARVVREASHQQEWSSLVPLNISGSRKPFFLVHSYMLYGRLPTALGSDYPFYGLRQPPLGKYSTPDWVDHMLQDHIRNIRIIQPKGPYQIGGWCFAGLMAYEVARRLRAGGEEVSLLALFDSWCPYTPPAATPTPESIAPGTAQPGAVRSFLGSQIYAVTYHLNRLTEIERHKRWHYTQMVLREAYWKVVNRHIRRMKGAAYRFFGARRLPQPPLLRDVTVVTYEWIRSYKQQPYDGPITLIRPADVPIPAEADPTCGWGQMTSGPVQSIFIPGDRQTMFLEPNLDLLVATLRELGAS